MSNTKTGKLRGIAAKLGLVLIAATAFGNAQAFTMLGQEPPAELIVDAGGFEWAYAGPCAGENPSCGTVTLHHGFTFATDEQWNLSFTTLDSLHSAFVGKCAASYFNNVYDHCDPSDILSGYVWHSPLAPTESLRNSVIAETFLVRAPQVETVPEPASLALLSIGLLGFAARRKAMDKRI